MAQFQWTVLGVTGKNHKVGLYHGDKSGHLMVHCDFNVILVDFNIKESKNYSFFLDEELYELSLEKTGTHFQYGLNANRTADTPLNRQIKKRDKSHLTKAILLFSIFIGGIFFLMNIIPYYQTKKAEENRVEVLSNEGKETIVHFKPYKDSINLKYSFVAKGETYSQIFDHLNFKSTYERLFPVEADDKYFLKYWSSNPDIHDILWHKPTASQLEKLKERTRKVHQQQNPQYSKEKVACEVDLAYQINKLEGLATIFYQNESTDKKFNQTTYLKFIRGEPFRKIAERHCWQ